MPRPTITPDSPVYEVRKIPHAVRLHLAVRAGGRCEFDGCNKFLFRHDLTRKPGIFGEAAHIVAFREGGPRGLAKRPVGEAINDPDNLMLLCQKDHKFIDDHPDDYPPRRLKAFKRAHERRIERLLNYKPDSLTYPLVFNGNIRKEPIDISTAHVLDAIEPRYPVEDPFPIDLSQVPDDASAAYLETTFRAVRDGIESFYRQFENKNAKHISVFALGSIPVLVYFGSRLNDKIATDLFQRHRRGQDWKWRTAGLPAKYDLREIHVGSPGTPVSMILSLSAQIALDRLPASIRSGTVLELILVSESPHQKFLNRKDDLEEFESVYEMALRRIEALRPDASEIHLFPAVPAPVAVACGRALMSPDQLIVYDRRGETYVPSPPICKGAK